MLFAAGGTTRCGRIRTRTIPGDSSTRHEGQCAHRARDCQFAGALAAKLDAEITGAIEHFVPAAVVAVVIVNVVVSVIVVSVDLVVIVVIVVDVNVNVFDVNVVGVIVVTMIALENIYLDVGIAVSVVAAAVTVAVAHVIVIMLMHNAATTTIQSIIIITIITPPLSFPFRLPHAFQLSMRALSILMLLLQMLPLFRQLIRLEDLMQLARPNEYSQRPDQRLMRVLLVPIFPRTTPATRR